MQEHWAKYPPVHISVALYLGIKSDAKPGKSSPATEASLANWIAEMPTKTFPRAGDAERARARATLQ